MRYDTNTIELNLPWTAPSIIAYGSAVIDVSVDGQKAEF